jgi:hypothetical protein
VKIDDKYRNIRMWMADGGIEIGYCDGGYSNVTARVIDDGGVVWETEETFTSLEAVLDAIEAAIANWCDEHGIEWRED